MTSRSSISKATSSSSRLDPNGDAVINLAGTEEALAAVADAMEAAGYCDAAHVLPGVGVYLEE